MLNRVKSKIKTLIYGSNYNSLIATDKYYNKFGKMRAARTVRKAHELWPKLDAPKLRALKNIHADRRRGFIICNGPSLNTLDLSKLKDEITIGVNAIYLNFENMGFKPSYYIVEDNLVGEDRGDDINQIGGTVKLFAVRLAYCLKRDEDTIFLNHSPQMNPWPDQKAKFGMDMKFSEDVSIATFGGNTVTYTSLQIAYHLGLREIYIIGADHDYKVPDRYDGRDKDVNYVIDPEEEDVNHFHPSYFGKGYRWHNPKVHKIENAYKNAKMFYEANGGKIFNATPGGKLEVFDRVNYGELFLPDYVNPVYRDFREYYHNYTEAAPIAYDGDYMELNGDKYVSNELESKDLEGYTIETVLFSRCEIDSRTRKYTDTFPPMPMNIPPLGIYQTKNRELRIRLNKDFDFKFDRFSSHQWYKIALSADKINNKTILYINGKPVMEKPLYISLKGNFSVGRGMKKRYWKGYVGYVTVKGQHSDGRQSQLLELRS